MSHLLSPAELKAHKFSVENLCVGEGTRTPNPLLAKQRRYQLCHAPKFYYRPTNQIWLIEVPQAGFEPTFHSVTAHKVEACAGTGAHNTPLGCVVELAAGLEPASSNYYHTDSESVEIRKQAKLFYVAAVSHHIRRPHKPPSRKYIHMFVCYVFVGVTGFEPAVSCSQSRRVNQATLHPVMFVVVKAYHTILWLSTAPMIGHIFDAMLKIMGLHTAVSKLAGSAPSLFNLSSYFFGL